MRIRQFTASAMMALMPLAAHAAGIQVIIDGKAVVFSDVQSETWFAPHVRTAAEAGIVSGYRDAYGKPTGKFGPSNSITVAEALKIAVEGAGYDEDAFATYVTSGVNHWSSKYVSVAKSQGFPVIADRMKLDRAATRAEVAALMTAAFRVNTGDVSIGNRYTDVSANTQHAASIEVLTNDGVVSGDTDIHGQATGTFRPAFVINRAEVAKMIVLARAEYGTPGADIVPEEQTGENQTEQNIVTYTVDGFSPAVLRVKKDTTVTFRNNASGDLWVASDPHPTHTGLSAFDANGGIGQGQIYTFTFTRLGTFGYHNHLNASHKATIVVEE